MRSINSEKEFHNSKFAQANSCQRPSKYYLALERWYSHYMGQVLNADVSHVLEIGSGIESISMQIENAPFDLQSIDIATEAIHFSRLNSRFRKACFSVQDAHNLSFPNSSFDLVAGRGILHHLNIPIACREIRRVLKPRGKIVFGEPLGGNFLINFYRLCTPQSRTETERPLSSNDLTIIGKHFGSLDVVYYGFLTLALALFGFKSPRIVHELDDLILNKLGLGKYFAWACILSTAKESK